MDKFINISEDMIRLEAGGCLPAGRQGSWKKNYFKLLLKLRDPSQLYVNSL